jgi:hypothetical protein
MLPVMMLLEAFASGRVSAMTLPRISSVVFFNDSGFSRRRRMARSAGKRSHFS